MSLSWILVLWGGGVAGELQRWRKFRGRERVHLAPAVPLYIFLQNLRKNVYYIDLGRWWRVQCTIIWQGKVNISSMMKLLPAPVAWNGA